MADVLAPAPATNGTGFLPGDLGLRLDEAFTSISVLHSDPDELNAMAPMGQAIHMSETTLLRLWPDRIWACGVIPEGAFRRVDISHGQVQLRLRGVEALHFLDFYTRADLFAVQVRANKTIRTRLNHFDVVLWWSNTRDVRILLTRSLAQSFCDHIRTLALRHDPVDPSLTPRPVAPDAPDRRG